MDNIIKVVMRCMHECCTYVAYIIYTNNMNNYLIHSKPTISTVIHFNAVEIMNPARFRNKTIKSLTVILIVTE